MRMFFGRLLYRLGLRLCGISPAHTVRLSASTFSPEQIKAFVGRVVLLPECPAVVNVGIPTEAWAVAGDGTANGRGVPPGAKDMLRLFYRKAKFRGPPDGPAAVPTA